MMYLMFKLKRGSIQRTSSFCSMSWIFGIGDRCLLVHLFDFLKPVIGHKDPSGLDMVNIQHAHSDLLIFLSVLCLHSLVPTSSKFYFLQVWYWVWYSMIWFANWISQDQIYWICVLSASCFIKQVLIPSMGKQQMLYVFFYKLLTFLYQLY